MPLAHIEHYLIAADDMAFTVLVQSVAAMRTPEVPMSMPRTASMLIWSPWQVQPWRIARRTKMPEGVSVGAIESETKALYERLLAAGENAAFLERSREIQASVA